MLTQQPEHQSKKKMLASSKKPSSSEWSPTPRSPSSPISPSSLTPPSTTSSASLASTSTSTSSQPNILSNPNMLPPLLESESKVPAKPQSECHLQSQSQSQSESQAESQLHAKAQSERKPQPRPGSLILWRVWVWYIAIPIFIVCWIELENFALAILAAVFPFIWANIQGTWGIVKYRIFYGDTPHPEIPAHGVVIVDPEDRNMSLSSSPSSPSLCLKSSSIKDVHYLSERAINTNQTKPPLRLLVLGDSLAIGVGQRKFSTPVLPEVIAKTLSKSLGGRTVYWSCYGAPGASCGWIFRELERGFQIKKPDHNIYSDDSKDNEEEEEDHEEVIILDENGCLNSSAKTDVFDNCSDSTDTDASSLSDNSLDESSNDGFRFRSRQQQQQQQAPRRTYTQKERRRTVQVWKERLKEHRKRFHPEAEVLGPYDIVVLITGGNDLKCCLMPKFILTGEDHKFREQAKDRGGLDSELRRLLSKINEKMRPRCNPLGESIDRCSLKQRQGNNNGNGLRQRSNVLQSVPNAHEKHENGCIQRQKSIRGDEVENQPPHEPLVVLPGMISRSLPVFKKKPLHWLSVPVVRMMDAQKRHVAESLPGKVLFVRDPTEEELQDYCAGKGRYWEQRCNEDILLSLKDIHKTRSNNIEEDMKAYQIRKNTNYVAKVFQDTCLKTDQCWAVDGVHGNDEGYDVWGRHIATHIVQEVLKSKKFD